MNKWCTEIEELEQKHDHHYLHIKIRSITNVKDFQVLEICNGKAEENIYYEKREIKDRWFEYIEKLLDDTRDDGILSAIRNNIEWEPSILMC